MKFLGTNIHKLQKTLFFVIIFFISSQVGLHFWPEFSKMSGIRIDYLSPTLYLLDILILGWIVLCGVSPSTLVRLRSPQALRVRIKSHFLMVLFLLFTFSLVWNLFLARSPGAHIFGLIKLAEVGLFGWLVAKTFVIKDIPFFVRTLALSSIVSSVLSIWQFLNQSSIGGLWYFLGERAFNSSTIGISTVNLESQLLRPYAAFPHPNVLAFFLLATIVFASLRIAHEKGILIKSFLIISILISSIALIITFSRGAILIAACFLLYVIYSKTKKNWIRSGFILAALLLAFGIAFSGIFNLSFLLRGIDFRQELLAQSFSIFSNNLCFGIGLNNFFIHQAPLIKEVSPILFQPPHNIFVLALLQLGIFGFWIFPAVFVAASLSLFAKLRTPSTSLRASKNYELKGFHKSVLFILLAIIIVGMFDHFFLTLEQGQIIFALILGLSFAKFKTNN